MNNFILVILLTAGSAVALFVILYLVVLFSTILNSGKIPKDLKEILYLDPVAHWFEN